MANPKPTGGGEPLFHANAALMLVESLIHALVAKGILVLHEAIEIVEIAAESERAVAQALNGDAGPISLLEPITQTLRIDLRD